MKRRIFIVIFVFTVLSGNLLFAAQITKVGIVDLSKIYSIYFRESKEVIKLEELKSAYLKEIADKREEINLLKSEKLDAENNKDEQKALELDKEIFNKEQFLKEYTQVKTQQLRQMAQSLSQSSQFVNEIADVIQYVAEEEGFSLILKKSDQFLFWTPEMDITDKVINELLKRAGRTNESSAQ
ncbi:MAG: OmpH family outer membrane protein [Spirochaetales bacterium]|nr:OmpH family outer membrane protein [Spirochaetales bacterium]RKX85782.1 MAG: OmpH family outer membrane protein [Spirochaetota bacterium]